MSAKTPVYAKAKPITSISGANATHKHVTTLLRAQSLLRAQGTEQAFYAANAMQETLNSYSIALRNFYNSEHYPYRNAAKVVVK